jgi:hypothetical protein
MKLLIFKSKATKAVYSWNGKEVVTIIGSTRRPVATIQKGIPSEIISEAYISTAKEFYVGDAVYSVLHRI